MNHLAKVLTNQAFSEGNLLEVYAAQFSIVSIHHSKAKQGVSGVEIEINNIRKLSFQILIIRVSSVILVSD